MKRKEIIEIEKARGLRPNKKLGQNFLVSDDVVNRIIGVLELNKDLSVLEIGPGLGALTEPLASRTGSLTAVEIDSGFVKYLRDKFEGEGKVEIVHGDFLRLHLEDRFDIVVSNLPYYCASEIIFRLAHDFSAPAIYVMVQKELAERIVSGPGHKNYGALSVNIMLYFQVDLLFHIGRSSFYPSPDVNSSFIRLTRKKINLSDSEREAFHTFVKSAFWGRRKTMARALIDSPHLALSRGDVENLLEKANIERNARGEELSFDDYVRLAKIVSST